MVNIFVPDNSVTTGAGVTGLSKDSVNLVVAVRREFSATETLYAQSAGNLETQTTIGTFQAPSTSAKARIKETPNPGQYEIQFHDTSAHFAVGDGSTKVYLRLYEATTTSLKIGPNVKEIQLVAFDLQVATQKVDVDTIKTSATAASTLMTSLEVMKVCAVDDANFVPTVTEFETSDITAAQADKLIGRCVVFTSGDLTLQAAWIEDYAIAAGKGHLTVSTLVAAPADADGFLLI
jgi:hypothetical protein